jgi:two-component system, LytTR family, sensor kinase
MRSRRGLKWGLAFLCWTLLGLIFSSQSYVYYAVRGGDVRWLPTLTWVFADWYAWAALSPLILWLARRFRVERRGRTRALILHLAAGVLFTVVHAALQAAVNQIGVGHSPLPFPQLFKYLLLENYSLSLLTYWVLIGISHAAEYYRRYKEREALLAGAQLRALKMQLQPHFLFNSLNSISALIDEDRDAAVRMVARLGDFLRMTLRNSGEQEVSLGQELEFLRSYLEIEMIRFEDRLAVELDIGPETFAAKVPNLILQPIVENAIHHGVSRSEERGRIEVLARRVNGTLRLRVADNGPGLDGAPDASSPSAEGLGLANTKARLQNLYGDAHRFELSEAPGSGLVVTMQIPFEVAAPRQDGTEEMSDGDESADSRADS